VQIFQQLKLFQSPQNTTKGLVKLTFKKSQIFANWSQLSILEQELEFFEAIRGMVSSMYYWDWA